MRKLTVLNIKKTRENRNIQEPHQQTTSTERQVPNPGLAQTKTAVSTVSTGTKPSIVDIFGMTKYCKNAILSRPAYRIENGFIWSQSCSVIVMTLT